MRCCSYCMIWSVCFISSMNTVTVVRILSGGGSLCIMALFGCCVLVTCKQILLRQQHIVIFYGKNAGFTAQVIYICLKMASSRIFTWPNFGSSGDFFNGNHLTVVSIQVQHN